jgi:hypothetical protein
VSGRYLYCSLDAAARRTQLLARQAQEDLASAGGLGLGVLPDELKAAIVVFSSLLDEKQRRLYAGIESLKWGHGGDRKIAELLGMDVGTVARGRRDLLAQDFQTEGIRRSGAGRKPLVTSQQSGPRYYGITGNSKSVYRYSYWSRRLIYKWINRRSQKRSYTWETFSHYLELHPLPKPRIVHRLYYAPAAL